jgi:hypothetical protein
MKILITGTRGLAQELAFVHRDHDVTAVSLSTRHDILKIEQWGQDFLGHDLVFNCAYSGLGQVTVLDYFYRNWFNLADKTIVSIGSKVISQPRAEIARDYEYWPYREHKQQLQYMHDRLWPTALCDLKIINPGAFDSDMVAHLTVPKLNLYELAMRIKKYAQDPVIKRVDLWL